MAKLTAAVSRIIDAIGGLSGEETEMVALHAMGQLDNESLMNVIEEVTDEQDKDELATIWGER